MKIEIKIPKRIYEEAVNKGIDIQDLFQNIADYWVKRERRLLKEKHADI